MEPIFHVQSALLSYSEGPGYKYMRVIEFATDRIHSETGL